MIQMRGAKKEQILIGIFLTSGIDEAMRAKKAKSEKLKIIREKMIDIYKDTDF